MEGGKRSIKWDLQHAFSARSYRMGRCNLGETVSEITLNSFKVKTSIVIWAHKQTSNQCSLQNRRVTCSSRSTHDYLHHCILYQLKLLDILQGQPRKEHIAVVQSGGD